MQNIRLIVEIVGAAAAVVALIWKIITTHKETLNAIESLQEDLAVVRDMVVQDMTVSASTVQPEHVPSCVVG